MEITINLWGSHPDEGNDDCWTGIDFDSLDEAKRIFNADDPILEMSKLPDVWEHFYSYYSDVSYIELDCLDGRKVRQLRKPGGHQTNEADNEQKAEAAMQAGMAFGCQGYNDEMGW